MQRTTGITTMLLLLQVGFVMGDERAVVRELQRLVIRQDYVEAARVYDQGLKDFPKSSIVRRNGFMMYSFMMRANKPEKALAYLDDFVDHAFDQPITRRSLGAYAKIHLAGLDRLKKTVEANEKLEEWIKRAEGLESGKDSVLATLLGQKAIRLANQGQRDAAIALLAKQLAVVRQRHETEKDNPQAGLSVTETLRVEVVVEMALQTGKVDEAFEEYVAFATSEAAKHSDNVSVLGAYANAKLQATNRILSLDPAKAETYLAELEEKFSTLDDSNPALLAYKQTITRAIATTRRRVTESKRLLAIVGKPAQPIGQADWLNGDPLTDDDLKGKVVLIDFGPSGADLVSRRSRTFESGTRSTPTRGS